MITLSPKLTQVVSGQVLDCINGNLSLNRKDIDTLTKTLTDKEKVKSTVNRRRAVNAFIQIAKDNELSEVLGAQWAKLQSNPLTKKQLQESIPSLKNNTFELRLSNDIGFEITCGKAINTLFLNDRFKSGSLLKNLKSCSQISGIVAVRNPKEPISTVRNIVITHLSKSGIDIMITRTTGEVVYTGDMKPEGKIWRFTLRDIDLTSAPTTITGTISDKKLCSKLIPSTSTELKPTRKFDTRTKPQSL